MTNANQGRSGKIFFAVLLACLLAAILATVLLANDYRNLNRVLARFGFDPVMAHQAAPELRPHEAKGNRMPRPQVEIPERLVSRLVPVQTRFVRSIRRNPQDLCEALKTGGFVDYGWRAGAIASSGWECSSYREFPVEPENPTRPSSIFVSIRGNEETHISSFRVKLNFENPKDREELSEAVIAAIRTFLEEVNWEKTPEIFDNIRSLTEFDNVRFGNRIQFKKEFSETPRYNFLITPDRTVPKNSYLPDYFNRNLWLPMPDTSGDRS